MWLSIIEGYFVFAFTLKGEATKHPKVKVPQTVPDSLYTLSHLIFQTVPQGRQKY